MSIWRPVRAEADRLERECKELTGEVESDIDENDIREMERTATSFYGEEEEEEEEGGEFNLMDETVDSPRRKSKAGEKMGDKNTILKL